MNNMREADSCGTMTVASEDGMLYACVLADFDSVWQIHALRVAAEHGVQWIEVGKTAAFVADSGARARDAALHACRTMQDDPAGSEQGELSAPVPHSGLQHRAHYTWPLVDGAFVSCAALARDNGERIEVFSAASDKARLLGALTDATGLPVTRFALHGLESGPRGAPGATSAALAAVALMRQAGRAVRVDGFLSLRAGGSAMLSVGASLDVEGRLLDWRYIAAAADPSHAKPSREGQIPYVSRHTASLIDDEGEAIPRAAHAFARESFVDEIARDNRIDPIDFRLDHLDLVEDAGARELIGSLVQRAGWNREARKTPGHGELAHGRGFAFDKREEAADGTRTPEYSAWIVDLDVNRLTGDVNLRRVIAGRAQGRRSLNAIMGVPARQIAAAASRLLGLPFAAEPTHDETPDSRAVSHRLTPVPARAAASASLEQADDRMHDARIDASPAAAAIANALYDATGVRFRAPPFTPERVRAALGDSKAPRHALPQRVRRSLRAAFAAGGLGSLIALACTAWPVRAPIAPIAPIDRPASSTWSEATIARGREVAAFGDCAVCHTAPGGATNAGGLALETPFGIVFSTNLTPDPKTGIGNWSFGAFDRAMRQGISRDGHHLYPAFPYTAFTKLSEPDMTALYAYLMSQPAIESAPPQTRLPFPLDQRGLVAGWNALYLKQGAFVPEPSRSAQWNRGAYLVDGAGHCSACHSPRNVLGAEKGASFYLTGGSAEGWVAPSLVANSKSPVRWTEDALFDYLRTGFSREHGVAAGPMAPVVAGLSTLPEADVRAMAHYVASLSPVTAKTAPTAVPKTDAIRLQGLESGRRIFEGACAVCHTEAGGVGNFGVRPLLAINTSVSEASPENLLHVILHGIDAPATSELGYMPGFRDSLDDRQVADLVAYIRGRFAPGEASWNDLARASVQIRNQVH
ncbi:cytochrome C [Caballeronia choica]|uniref:Cytochrome C n=2 Tax=Caballeronia choica TaxID=326476 RepID=A0A158I5M7_9BURK|nr:cytochrome C [Caballeronia choica]